jgi:hypothetical protein
MNYLVPLTIYDCLVPERHDPMVQHYMVLVERNAPSKLGHKPVILTRMFRGFLQLHHTNAKIALKPFVLKYFL